MKQSWRTDSIVADYTEGAYCYLTGRQDNLDRHHCLTNALRDWAEENGLWVYLNHDVHMLLHQQRPDIEKRLKAKAQKAYEKTHSHDEWMKVVRKNYL